MPSAEQQPGTQTGITGAPQKHRREGVSVIPRFILHVSWRAALSGPISCPPGSCAAPTRLRFAALSKADERINFFPVGTNVSYVCRPGYENTSESSPTSTCLDSLAWSEAAELCRSEYLCSAPLANSGCGVWSGSGRSSQLGSHHPNSYLLSTKLGGYSWT